MPKLQAHLIHLRDKAGEVLAVLEVVVDLLEKAEERLSTDGIGGFNAGRWRPPQPGFGAPAGEFLDEAGGLVDRAQCFLAGRLEDLNEILAADGEAEMRRLARHHHFVVDDDDVAAKLTAFTEIPELTEIPEKLH